MDWPLLLWFGLMILFIWTEATTVSVVSLWFALGSLAALIAALLKAEFWLQLVLFLVVSGVLLALLRPVVRKYLTPKLVHTNVDAIIGTVGRVTTQIHNDLAQGQVKLGSMEWTARSTSGQTIPQGTLVKVDRIEGVKVFVSEAEVPAQTK